MTDPSRRGSTGVIAGFPIIDLSGSGTTEELQPGGFSWAMVQQQIAQLRQDFSPAALAALTEEMLAHTQRTDNPHHDTLANLVINLAGEVFAPFMPGTLPLAPPTLAVLAGLSGLAPLSVTRAGPLTLIGSDGYLVTYPAHTLALDGRHGAPLLALPPARTNRLTNNDVATTAELAATGGSLGSDAGVALLDPARGAGYRVLTEAAGAGEHGAVLTVAHTAGAEYTTGLFVRPLSDTGQLTLRLDTATPRWLRVDLASRLVTTSDASVLPHVLALPNGWWVVALQYVAPATASETLHLLYSPSADDTSYPGTAGLPRFAVWGPQHLDGAGWGPYIATSAGPVSTAASSASLVLAGAWGLEQGMLGLRYTGDVSLLSAGGALYSLDGGLLGAALSGATLTTTLNTAPPIVHSATLAGDALAGYGLSWASSGLASRVSGSARAVTATALPALPSATTLTLGPWPGFYESLTLYPVADDGAALDFLVGEPG